MRKTILVAVTLCCVALIGLSAIALTAKAQEEPTTTSIGQEEVSAADLGISEPTLLPGSRFYFLKDWWRGVKSAFTFGQEKKAELKLQFASERLLEVKELVKQNKKEYMEKAMEKYGQGLDEIKGMADKMEGNASSSENISQFLDKYANQQVLHTEILDKLKEQVPENVAQKIEQQREQHLERFNEVMQKLETRKDKIQERVENALQNAEDKIQGFRERINQRTSPQVQEQGQEQEQNQNQGEDIQNQEQNQNQNGTGEENDDEANDDENETPNDQGQQGQGGQN